MTAFATPQPTRLLIAALGGEGGGVLAGWITDAAVASGLVTSRTSIPGVAQRTGATTYYIEMVAAETGQPRPVLTLNPAPGQVDVLLASELLEATRLAGNGMISSERTTLIANTARIYTMDEKMAMADGRIDSERLAGVLRNAAKRALLADLTATAATSKTQISSVLLGALAAAKVLPVTDDALRDAIRREGKAVDTNLAGFKAGYDTLMRATGPASNFSATPPAAPSAAEATVAALPEFPARASMIAAEGVKRLTDYQGAAYTETYLTHLRRFAKLPGVDDGLLSEFARHLAVRMSVEDVIRVAQLKLRQARVARVTAEARSRPGDIVDITEFMKPGTEEIIGLLPPSLARPLLRTASRLGWAQASMPLNVTTTRFGGFLRLKFLAGLKSWRPRTHKFHEEQIWLSRWMGLVEATAMRDPAAAREVIITAKLVRGYGDTYRRGLANWERIAVAVIEPPLAGGTSSPNWADEILQARIAAEKDPEGQALSATLAAITARRAAPPMDAQ
jgi:indolepyruvate ferredoxin oxidoreductase beta subunit